MLEFREADHLYLIDGQPVPSVTRLLARFGFIADYRSFDPSGRYAARGKAIHDGTRFVEQGVWDPDTTTPELVPYLYGWQKFLSENRVEVLESEVHVCSDRWLVAGTIDKIALVDGHRSIIEIKTGRAEPWHRLQLACYVELASQEHGPTERPVIVYLDRDGNYSVVDIEDEDREAAICLLTLGTWIVKSGLL